MSFWQEFRAFAIKGNVLDLAIAVVVGNAFSAVVNSLVGDIITPLLGVVTGNGATDVKNYALVLHGVSIRWGNFLYTIINFFIISLSIFIVFKFITAARKRVFREGEKAVPAEQKPPEERLLEEIRDLLKEKK